MDMEWSEESILNLVESYKLFKNLWDPKDKDYFKKEKKVDAWNEIASAVGKSTEAIKKKISSLLATYRKEKNKAKSSMGTGKGSCLSYGHACWGAHGKRSGSQAQFPRANDEAPSNKDEAKAKLFLSKLISPLDLRYYRDGNEVDTPNNRPRIEDLLTDIDVENIKSANDWDSFSDMVKNDNRLEESIDNERNIENLFKSSKFMDKRSTKQQ